MLRHRHGGTEGGSGGVSRISESQEGWVTDGVAWGVGGNVEIIENMKVMARVHAGVWGDEEMRALKRVDAVRPELEGTQLGMVVMYLVAHAGWSGSASGGAGGVSYPIIVTSTKNICLQA